MSQLSDEDFAQLVKSLVSLEGEDTQGGGQGSDPLGRQILRLYVKAYHMPPETKRVSMRFDITPDIRDVDSGCQAILEGLQETTRRTEICDWDRGISLRDALQASGDSPTPASLEVQADVQQAAMNVFVANPELSSYLPRVTSYAEAQQYLTRLHACPWRNILTKSLCGQTTESVRIFVANSMDDTIKQLFPDPDTASYLRGPLASVLSRCELFGGHIDLDERKHAQLFSGLSKAFAENYLLKDALPLLANTDNWDTHLARLNLDEEYEGRYESMNALIAARRQANKTERDAQTISLYVSKPMAINSRWYPRLELDVRCLSDTTAAILGSSVRKVTGLSTQSGLRSWERAEQIVLKDGFTCLLKHLIGEDSPFADWDMHYMSEEEKVAHKSDIEGSKALQRTARICWLAYMDKLDELSDCDD